MIKRIFGNYYIEIDLGEIKIFNASVKNESIKFSVKQFEELIDWYNNGKEHWKEKTIEYKKRKGIE